MKSESLSLKYLSLSLLPILALVAVIYYQILDFDFLLNFDDDAIILSSPEFKELSWENIKHIFSNFKEGLYHPITSLSWMIEYELWGKDSWMFHAGNLIFHLLNCVLVFLLGRSISGKVTIGLIAALLFGIHPMHVENVAWLSSRKDLVLGFFFLLSLLFYSRYLNAKQRSWYLLSMVFALLAMLSKAAAVVIPLLMILMDWMKDAESWKQKIIAKLPLILPAGLIIYVNYLAQKEYGIIRNMDPELGVFDQISYVFYSAAYYLVKFFIPLDLAPKNLYPDVASGLPWYYYGSIILMLVVVALLVILRKKQKWLVFGLVFFLIAIAPYLKIIPSGNDIVSNRYAYMAFIGLYMSLAYYLGKSTKLVHYLPLLIIVVFWSRESYLYADTFKDSRTVWSAVIDAHQDREWGLAMAYNERGQVAFKNGKYGVARNDYDMALGIEPELRRGLINRANVLERLGEYEAALKDVTFFMELEDSSALALNLRSTIQGKMGNTEAALKDLESAKVLDPKNPELFNNLGIIYSIQSDFEKARMNFKKSIALEPKFLQARLNLGKLYLGRKMSDSALAQLAVVYDAEPDLFYNAYLLSKVYYQMNEDEKAKIILKPFAKNETQASQIAVQLFRDSLIEESIPYFNIAIGDQEIRSKSLYQRSQAYKTLGQTQNAIDDLLAVVEEIPNGAFFYELGLLYLELNNLEKACEFFGEAEKRKIKQAVEMREKYCVNP